MTVYELSILIKVKFKVSNTIHPSTVKLLKMTVLCTDVQSAFIVGGGGAVAEWYQALLNRKQINENRHQREKG